MNIDINIITKLTGKPGMIKSYLNLCNGTIKSINDDELMELLIEEDINYFKFYDGNNQKIINFAMNNNYQFKEEDFQNSYFLGYNDELMLFLLKKDISYFKYYMGDTKEITQYAINNGYAFKEEDFKNNYGFCRNDIIFKHILEKDINFFKYYKGKSNEIIEYAINNNYNFTVEDLKRNDNLQRNNKLIYTLMQKDINYFKYYKENNKVVINYALENGYNFTIEDLQNNSHLSSNTRVMKQMIKKDISYFKYYKGNNEEITNYALNNGYKVTKEDLENRIGLNQNESLMQKLIKEDISYFEYYKGGNESLIEYAIENGYNFTNKDLENNKYLCSNDLLMDKLIKKDITLFRYYKGSDEEIINYAITNGYKIKESDLKNNFNLGYIDTLMFSIIKENINHFKYYNGNNSRIIDYAIDNNYPFNKDSLRNNSYLSHNDKLMNRLIREDINYFSYYRGSNKEIMDYVASTGYIPTEKDLTGNENILYNDKLIENLLLQNISNIKYYKGSNANLYNHALKEGYIPTFEDIYENEVFAKLIEEKTLYNLIKKQEDLFLIEICNKPETTEFIKEQISTIKFNNIPIFLLEGLYYYKKDKLELIESINEVESFLEKINITLKDYVKISLGSSYDWLEGIKTLIKNNKIEDFNNSLNYFLNNYYKVTDNANKSIVIDCINDMLKNYIKYPEIIDSITNSKKTITESEKIKLNYLFNINIALENQFKPQNINELDKINNLLKETFLDKLNSININDVESMKQTICQILFNNELENINNNFKIYGNVKTLKQLKFNNKHNQEVQKNIDEIMIYTSIMEDISILEDPIILRKLCNKIGNNLDLAIECSKLFNGYEEKMKKLYELDLIQNLTPIYKVKNYNSILNKELSNKYGIDVIDFTNKDYVLIAHVKSDTETVEELVEGNSDNKLFLSTIPISYRNQVYYYDRDDGLILGTDEFPKNTFICSSISNMSTNSKINKNSTEVLPIDHRTQRGILETSSSSKGNNAEIFSLREGIKFKYIILPNGREPNEFLVEIAKKHNLKFIMTQPNREMIENPKKIEFTPDNEEKTNTVDIEYLKEIKEKLLKLSQNAKKRKVAILTDLHGLFEPTLAILEDIRKKGITEIYSLGDNIGTGPNPKEVLNLLKEYNVKSIKGNHELYITKGVENMKEHFESYTSYNEALKNSEWTKQNLTNSQIEEINKYPSQIDLNIGGKKVILCHSIKDYITQKEVINSSEYDEVFQGHVHFENQQGNITTVRGAAIGGNDDNYNQAYYITLKELPNGGYETEKNIIEYDTNNLKHSINESEALITDKEKIINWTGLKRK